MYHKKQIDKCQSKQDKRKFNPLKDDMQLPDLPVPSRFFFVFLLCLTESMYDILKKYIAGRVQISDDDFDKIRSLSSVKKLRRNQYLLQEGDVCKFSVFMLKGCIRTYTVDEKGLEHIVYFAIENWWGGDQESFHSGEPSRYNIDAVEESEMILFSKAQFEQICKEIPAFNEMINQILQKSFIASQNRINVAISYKAEDKYLDFLKKHPGLISRVPQQMIASYLGITAETLSRVRKAVHRKSQL